MDLTITAADVQDSSSTKSSGVAGETITAGQVVYLKSSDSRLWKAQCDGTAAEATAVGVAAHAALAGQPLAYYASGTIDIGATTVKTVYVVSATAGGIAPIADLATGNYISILGVASATDGTLVLNIRNTGVTAS